MANYIDRLSSRRFYIGNGAGGASSGSRTSTSLNSAYVNATSGAAVAIRYMAPAAQPIDKLYVFLDATTGTRGNVSVTAIIYNESSNAARPGTTVRATSSAASLPAGDDMWIEITFGTPYTPAVGEILWIVVTNTAGAPGTDYPQILTASNAFIGDGTGVGVWAPYTTSNGFSSNGTGAAKVPFVVLQNSVPYGQPFTQYSSTYYTSNQLERGIQFTPTEDIVVSGCVFDQASAYSKFRLLADATAPGGGAIAEYNLDSDTNETTNDICGSKYFDAAVTLSAGTTYKATITFGANTQRPGVWQIEDYSSYSSMFDILRGYDKINLPWSVIDNGASGWTIDKAVTPFVTLLVQDFPLIDTPSVTNVQNDDTVRGATGTLTVPATTDVKSGVQYGAGGTEFTGSYSAAGGGGPIMGGMVVR